MRQVESALGGAGAAGDGKLPDWALEELDKLLEPLSQLERTSPWGSRLLRLHRPAAGDGAAAPPGEPAPAVDSLRGRGNESFKRGDYLAAKQSYSAALQEEPGNPGLLSNRAAACMMLGEWEAACEDAGEAAKLDPSNAKAHERRLRCLLFRDRLQDGLVECQKRAQGLSTAQSAGQEWKAFMATSHRLSQHLSTVQQIDPILRDPAKKASTKPADQVILEVDKMLDQLSEMERKSPWGRRLRLCKLQALLLPAAGTSGQDQEERKEWAEWALDLAQALAAESPGSADAEHWRARCLLRLGRRQSAREALKEAMRLTDGDHPLTEEFLDGLRTSERMKEEGNEAFKRKDWDAAIGLYDAAISADRHRLDAAFSSALFCNRAAARAKKKQSAGALEDVSMAIALTPAYTKALFRRGILYMELERYREAAADFEQVHRLDASFVGLPQWRSRAKRWQMNPPARNHYGVLGLGIDASQADVKKAYKTLALKWHPDKNPDKSEGSDKVFKDIQMAFEVLSDPKKKEAFDGVDAEIFQDDCNADFFAGTSDYGGVGGMKFNPGGFAGPADFGNTGGGAGFNSYSGWNAPGFGRPTSYRPG